MYCPVLVVEAALEEIEKKREFFMTMMSQMHALDYFEKKATSLYKMEKPIS